MGTIASKCIEFDSTDAMGENGKVVELEVGPIPLGWLLKGICSQLGVEFDKAWGEELKGCDMTSFRDQLVLATVFTRWWFCGVTISYPFTRDTRRLEPKYDLMHERDGRLN